jgi:hypothetical protein
MKEFLKIAPSAIALVSFLMLALTVVHEWGYFFVIGSHFQTIASAYDYLSNAIIWLPQNLAIMCVGVVGGFLLGMLGGRSSNEDELGFIARAAKIKRRRRGIAIGVGVGFALSCVYALVGYFFMPPYLLVSIFATLATTTWMALCEVCERIFGRWFGFENRLVYLAIVVIPFLVFTDFCLGAQEAYDDIRDIASLYFLTLKDDPVSNIISNERPVQILRSFDKGLLVRDAKREKISFVRWETIKFLSHNSFAIGETPLGCERFPGICGSPPLVP